MAQWWNRGVYFVTGSSMGAWWRGVGKHAHSQQQMCGALGAVNLLQLSNNVLHSFVASTTTSFVGFEITR